MISIVIPVFNEEQNIPELYRRLTSSAPAWGEDYEVIVVNDGSTDATCERLRELHIQDARWKMLSLSRNFGHQTAISAGIYYTSGDAVAVLDADLQDPPEELSRFLDKWRQGYQVVYAIRTKRKEGILKRACYSLFYRILRRIASIDIPLDSGDFCIMDRSVVEVLRAMPERTRFVRGLRSWAGFRQAGVAYERSARHAGEPKYTFSKLMKLAIDGVLSFSNAPLKFASWMGISLCGIAILLLVLLLCWSISGIQIFGMTPRAVAGWTSLALLILLMAGLQFLVMGIIGQYVARIFDEVHARPPWIISQADGFSPDHGDLGWFVQSAGRSSAKL